MSDMGDDVVDGPHDPNREGDDLEDQWGMDDDEDDEGGAIDEESDSDDTELQEDAPQPIPSAPSAPSAPLVPSVPLATPAPSAGAREPIAATRTSNTSPSEPKPYVERLSKGCPGAPLPRVIGKDGHRLYQDDLHATGDTDNPWAPFKGKMDWEIARWAKLRGPGSTAVSELLSIDGVSVSFCLL